MFKEQKREYVTSPDGNEIKCPKDPETCPWGNKGLIRAAGIDTDIRNATKLASKNRQAVTVKSDCPKCREFAIVKVTPPPDQTIEIDQGKLSLSKPQDNTAI